MCSQAGAVLGRSGVEVWDDGEQPAATRASAETGRTSARVRGFAWVTEKNMIRWASEHLTRA